MTADEALKAILGKIEAPEELDEEINVITESIRSGAKHWLLPMFLAILPSMSPYTMRFGEMLAGQETPKADIEEPKADVGVVEDVTPEMLDFDGSTE